MNVFKLTILSSKFKLDLLRRHYPIDPLFKSALSADVAEIHSEYAHCTLRFVLEYRNISSMSKHLNSKAFRRFDDTFTRSAAILGSSEHLRKLQAGQLGGVGITATVPDDLLRSALVLTVAGMDAYFTDRFSEGLGTFLRTKIPPPSLIVMIEEAGFDTTEAIKAMVSMERPMRRVSSLLKEHLSGFTTTNISKIDGLYGQVGIKDFCKHVAAKAKKPVLIKLLQKAVHRRHEIVHAGDRNDHGKLQTIDLKTCKRLLLGIQNFVSVADELLAKVLPVPPPASPKAAPSPVATKQVTQDPTNP